MQVLESEVPHLREANTVTMSLRRVVSCFQQELGNAHTHGERDLSALQTRARADQDMLYAAGRDLICVQLFLDAERQKRQNVMRIITDLERRASHHSSLLCSASASLHSDMWHACEACSRSLWSEVAGCIRDCGSVYHSDVDTQL